MQMPTEDEIRAKAVELGVPVDDGPLPRGGRARAVQAILDERRKPTEARPPGHVLSRSTVAIADGHLEITVTHIPSEGTAQ